MENTTETTDNTVRTIETINIDYTREAALFGDAMFKTFVKMLMLDNEAKRLVAERQEQMDV